VNDPLRRLAVFRAIGLVLLGLLVVTVVAIFLVLMLGARDDSRKQLANQEELKRQSDQIARQADQIARLAEQVKDCTTPGGVCHDRNEAATATAVGSINTLTQIAVVCADQYDGRPAIEACIHDRLRAAGLEK
jgi:hypothetical protein